MKDRRNESKEPIIQPGGWVRLATVLTVIIIAVLFTQFIYSFAA